MLLVKQLIKKAIMVKLRAISMILFIAFNSFMIIAQKNYVKGYIVKPGNDTITGYINYLGWEVNPDYILFKENLNSIPVKYFPFQLEQFSVNNEYYYSKIISYNISPGDINKLQNSPKPLLKRDTLFLQLYLDGVAKLYYYKDNNLNNHFFIEMDTIFEELIYLKYYQSTDLINENLKYKGQLNYYFRDCPDILQRLNQIGYNERDIIQLFKLYNICRNVNITYQKRSEKLKFEFAALGGISVTSLYFNGYGYDDLEYAKFKNSTNLTIGTAFNLVFPGNLDRLVISNELFYKSYNFNVEHERWYRIVNIKFDVSYMRLNNIVKYKFPFQSYEPFLGIGISNSYAIRAESSKTVNNSVTPTLEEEKRKALESYKKYEQGYLLSTGMEFFDNYLFEYRIEISNGLSPYASLGSKVKSHYLLVGYRF